MTAEIPVEEQLKTFPPNLQRGQVIDLARLLGFSVNTVRTVIDGPDASLKGRTFGKSKRTYYQKEKVLKFFS